MSVVELRGVTLRLGHRTLFEQLDLVLERGAFLAVLGPNGAGKTSLMRLLLGLQRPTAGTVKVEGRDPAELRAAIGYVPQQRSFDRDLPLRGRDLVRLGLDGHRFGVRPAGASGRERVARALASVDATHYADRPIGRLSGGEQQRLRIAQALVCEPRLLLVDEPLLSLDLAHQRAVVELLDGHRRATGTPVVFVTHDVNPVLHAVDRVLYLAGDTWALGTPDEVMTSETLSSLYGTDVDVLRLRGRVVVVGTPDDEHHHH